MNTESGNRTKRRDSSKPDDRPGLIRPAARPGLIQRLRNSFLTGLVLVAPVLITGYLAWTFINLVDGTVLPLIPDRYQPELRLGVQIPGLGLIVFVLFTTLIGAFTANLAGRTVVRWGENLLHRMPIIRSIYNAVKQIAETALNSSNTSFRKACLIEYPRKGLWAVAFVSTEAGGEIGRKYQGRRGLVSVFLPTTPNPTSGFLLFVPEEDVTYLDMSVEEAAKLVISAGLVIPNDRSAAPPEPRIAEIPG